MRVLGLPMGAYSPTITADGLELYLNEGSTPARMWIATRASRELAFDPPTVLASPPATPTGENYDPSISDDGLTLYFNQTTTGTRVSTRSSRTTPFGASALVTSLPANASPDVSGDQLAMYLDNSVDLRVAHRSTITDSFGAPDAIPAPVSIAGATEAYPSIASDELALYFQSDRSGAPHLWVATRVDRTAAFTTVEELPFPSAKYNDPDISADGRDLYFATDLAGEFAIYVAHRACL